MENYEKLGSRKSQDSAEYFFCQKITGQVWIRSHSLWANSPGEDWMPLDGDCDELLLKWRNKTNMQEYATTKYLEKWGFRPTGRQINGGK